MPISYTVVAIDNRILNGGGNSMGGMLSQSAKQVPTDHRPINKWSVLLTGWLCCTENPGVETLVKECPQVQ